MFTCLNQIRALLLVGFRTLPQRKSTAGVVVIGIASVVAVLVSVLAVANGVNNTIRGSGRNDTAILLSSGADDEVDSLVSRTDYEAIVSMPEVVTDPSDKPFADGEVATVFPVRFKKSMEEGNITLRGVGTQGLSIHPSIHITDGRTFRPGLAELLVGSGVENQFRGFADGDRVKIGNLLWTVVGHFRSDDIFDSEVLADVHAVQSLTGIGNAYNSVYVRLKSAGELQSFKEAISSNPTLHLEVQSETKYFAAQSSSLSGALTTAAYVIGIIMACGALFGAIHSLYISADARKTEMATLRALGFGPASVLIGFLIEALSLALAGGCIGGALSWLLFDGHTATSMYGGMAQVVFHLDVSANLVELGVLWACAIGLLGALLPAVNASRLPVAEALRG